MATLYTLSNGNGANVTFTDFGAALVSANMPDKTGTLGPIALGFDNIESYETNPAYIGVVIGPVANRIGQAKFTLGNTCHELEENDGKNCLHSGAQGWHKQLWTCEQNSSGLCFTFKAQDGDGGFPGAVSAAIDVILSQDNHLIYRFRAKADKPTPIAMTRHEYFNLTDGGASRIDDHVVSIPSPSIAQLDTQNIATGDLVSVGEADLNLRQGMKLSETKNSTGALTFDHHFIIAGRGLRHMARAQSAISGRRLDVHATMDGVQFYTGQHMPRMSGKGGAEYGPSHGFALEPQARPNAVNLPFFPSIILLPGETYDETIIYEFGLID